jgi:RNA polymerase sigma-B factor
MSTATDSVAVMTPTSSPNTSTSDSPAPEPSLAHADALLILLRALAPGDARRVAVRAQAIEWYLPMAVHLARRYRGRGEPLADLTQVAVIGLIKSVDRYNAARGVPFTGFAIPTILGELRRHFRDSAWNVRVPRRLQELQPQLAIVIEELAQVLHRMPTTAELAARLGVSQADVRAARRCATAYRPLSLERPVPGGENLRLSDSLGGPDPRIEAVDSNEVLRRRLAELPERERRIIALRFDAGMTQTEIAAQMGVSQMHISRLLARTLTRLRDEMHIDAERVPAAAAAALVTHQATYAA